MIDKENQGATGKKIIASIQTTARELKAGLRDPISKTFPQTPSGLVQAAKWIKAKRQSLTLAQGNLSYPSASISFEDGRVFKNVDCLDLLADIEGEMFDGGKAQFAAARWLKAE